MHRIPDTMPRTLTILLAAALLAAPAIAQGPPAAIPDSGSERVERAFDDFASKWMIKIKGAAASQDTRSVYRTYGETIQTELRPTGHATAPYVGIIRYEEHEYRCANGNREQCSLASITPVTEIFRFQNGRWVY